MKQPGVPFPWAVALGVLCLALGLFAGIWIGSLKPASPTYFVLDSVEIDTSVSGEDGWFQVRYFAPGYGSPSVVQVHGVERRDALIRFLGGLR